MVEQRAARTQRLANVGDVQARTNPSRRDGASGSARTWRVAVVEDHLLQRTHTVELLSAQQDIEIVFSAETLPDLLSWLRTPPVPRLPDLLMLDLLVERGPSADPAVVEKLADAGVRILLFSAMASPPLVRKMMQAGVSGIVGKRDSETEIIAAARAVLAGDEWLTPDLAVAIAQDPARPSLGVQEERALVLYAAGLTLDAVAIEIGVKRDTAKKYLQRVKEKYAAAGRPLRSKVDMTHAVLTDGLSDLHTLRATRE